MATIETITPAERTAARKLLPMIWGIHISRCVYAVAELASLTCSLRAAELGELAADTRTHEPSLYRVLRDSAGLGVFEEPTPALQLHLVGERLRTGATARDAVVGRLHRGDRRRAAVRAHPRNIRTGKPGGRSSSAPICSSSSTDNEEAAATFDAAMAERTAAYAPSVAGL